MKLYLVRHAIAGERGPQYPDDSKRPLTVSGANRFRQVVKGLDALGVRLDLILTSPLVRARQTADLLSEYLPGRPPISETIALAPGAAEALILRELVDREDLTAVALVGHEPGLGELAASLIAAARPIPFKKGGACRIDIAPPFAAGDLRWFATPKMLRRVDR